MVETKTCSKCLHSKVVAEFYRNRSSPDGYRADCKACLRVNTTEKKLAQREHSLAKMKAYDVENADRLKSSRLKKNYNITLEDYVNMFEEQDGACKLCCKKSPNLLHIDHDHSCCPKKGSSCGKCIRGLLCGNCNVGLGNFQDDIQLLQRAIEYLRA